MIRVRGLSKRYAGGAAALDGVDLDVSTGEFIALIGPSGAGKSTLLRCINGLIIPTAGQIAVDGALVTGASPDGLRGVRARVGFVFQHFNLLKRLSVLDNVRVGTLSRVGTWSSLIARFPEADVFYWPATPEPAPRGLAWTGEPRYIAPWTAIGGPIVTLPAGKTRGDLPLGVLLCGRPGADLDMCRNARLLAAAVA